MACGVRPVGRPATCRRRESHNDKPAERGVLSGRALQRDGHCAARVGQAPRAMPDLVTWVKRHDAAPSPALRSSTAASDAGALRVTEFEQVQNQRTGPSIAGPNPRCNDAGYVKAGRKAIILVARCNGGAGLGPPGSSNVPDPGSRRQAWDRPDRGCSTTGDSRVRKTPARMAAAPTDWAAVTGSPSHTQATAMATIGMRLL